MISLDDYFAKMSRAESPSQDVRDNALDLLSRVNALLAEIPLEEAQKPRVNSGWRTVSHNLNTPGAAPNSRHITGQAIDLADPDGVLDEYLFTRLNRLVDHDLYMEHPLATKGWCHLQSTPPRSGNRVFIP